MKGQRVAAFGCPHPRGGLTGEGDLLATEARLVADHGAGAALAFQAVAHGDARWFALNHKVKLPAAAGHASSGHGSAPSLSMWAECRLDFKTMHYGQPVAGPERPVRTFECGFVPLTWRFVQKRLSLTPPALDPIGCLISTTDKKALASEGNALSS
jgi:hypothetical protein